MRGEELSQHGAALVFEDSTAYLGPVRQPPIPDDIPQRADGALLWLPGPEDHPGPSQLTAVGIVDDSADGYIEFGRLLRGRQSGADELLVLHAWP